MNIKNKNNYIYMDKIIVVDQFLLPDELKTVKDKMAEKKYKYYHTSNGVTDVDIPFWTTYLNDDKYFSEYIKSIIEKQFFKKFELQRVYCNAQSYGQDGSYHIDTDDEDCYTFCLYINNIKEYDIELACGHIFFKLPDLKYKICYEPINNRGILFPSNYLHKGASFSRFIKDLRLCIAFKLKEIKNNI